MTDFVTVGLAFWLGGSAVVGFGDSLYPGSPFMPGGSLFLAGVALAVAQLGLAYAALRGASWVAFAGGAVGVFILASTIFYSGLRYPGDEVLALVELQVIFFALARGLGGRLGRA